MKQSNNMSSSKSAAPQPADTEADNRLLELQRQHNMSSSSPTRNNQDNEDNNNNNNIANTDLSEMKQHTNHLHFSSVDKPALHSTPTAAPVKFLVEDHHVAEGHKRARGVIAGAASVGMLELVTPQKYDEIQENATAAAAMRDATDAQNAPPPFEKEKELTGTAAAIVMPISAAAQALSAAQMNVFLTRCFAYMFVGLLVTAVTSMFISATDFSLFLAGPSGVWVLLGLALAQITLVVFLVGILRKLTTVQALAIFLAYSVLTAVVFSPIFMIYSIQSIYIAFLSSAALFLVLAIVGLTTTADLTSMGPILGSCLTALIISMFVNMFFRSPAINFIISAAGIVIFAGLTMFDVQHLATLGEYLGNKGGSESVGSYAVMGALQLYLDFINIFLFMLKLFRGE